MAYKVQNTRTGTQARQRTTCARFVRIATTTSKLKTKRTIRKATAAGLFSTPNKLATDATNVADEVDLANAVDDFAAY